MWDWNSLGSWVRVVLAHSPAYPSGIRYDGGASADGKEGAKKTLGAFDLFIDSLIHLVMCLIHLLIW